jgi:hypothetical protein
VAQGVLGLCTSEEPSFKGGLAVLRGPTTHSQARVTHFYHAWISHIRRVGFLSGGWGCDVAGWWRRGGKAACENPSAQSSTHPPGGGVQSMDSGCEALSCGRGSSATPCGLSDDGVDPQGVSRGEKFRIGGAPPPHFCWLSKLRRAAHSARALAASPAT